MIMMDANTISHPDAGVKSPELPPEYVPGPKRQSLEQKALLLRQYLDSPHSNYALLWKPRPFSTSTADDLISLDPVNVSLLSSIFPPPTPDTSTANMTSAYSQPFTTYRTMQSVNKPTTTPFTISSQRQGSSRSSSIAPIASIPENDVLESSASSCGSSLDQSSDVHFDLKSTLTDLLNCETVRHDEQMRVWIQSRLMEAEHELKRHRRRRIGRAVSLSPETSSASESEASP